MFNQPVYLFNYYEIYPMRNACCIGLPKQNRMREEKNRLLTDVPSLLVLLCQEVD